MAGLKFRFHDSKGGSALTVRITSRASKNEVAGIQEDGTIRIRLNTKASGERLNIDLIKFLAVILDVPPDAIEVVAGHSSEDKLVTILNLDAETVHEKILALL